MPTAIDQAALQCIVDALEDDPLARFYACDNLSVQTIELLKEYSAQFYFSDPGRAVQIAKKTYQLSVHLPPPALALGSWALGNAYLHNARYTEADQQLTQAHALFLAYGNPLDAARLGVGHVGVLAYVGKLQEALQLAAQIEPILADSAPTNRADLRRLAALPTNIGVIYELLGQYEEALAVYERHLHTLERLGDQHLLARAHHNRAYAFAQMGAFHEALETYSYAEGLLLQAAEAQVDLVRLSMNRSQVYMMTGNMAAAMQNVQQAQERLAGAVGIEEATTHRLAILQAQLTLATESLLGEPMVAALMGAQTFFAANGPLIEEALVWLLLGKSHGQRSAIADAQRCFQQIIALVKEGANQSLVHQALYGLASVSERAGNSATALHYYHQAIERLEAMRNEFQIETLRASFLGDNLDIYRDLAALLIQQQEYANAFHVIERSKARLISEKLGSRLSGEINTILQAADQTVRPLAMRLKTALAELDARYQQARLDAWQNKAAEAHTASEAQTTAALENTIQDLIMRIQRSQSVFSPLSIGQTVALSQLQAELGEAIFLQYHRSGGKLGVFVVDQNAIRTHIELGSLQDVERANADFRHAIGRVLASIQTVEVGQMAAHLPALLKAVNKHLLRLYTLLFQPLRTWLSQEQLLLIAPDALLHSVPFHALYDGRAYLVEQFPIAYTPSATVFDFCTRQTPGGEGVLLVGYDAGNLAAVTREVQSLKQLYPYAQVALEQQATTEVLLAAAPRQRMLHVAAHAAFRVDKPMLSTITLADRGLTLAEISQLQLRAMLVSVSGCETGYGQLRGGDMLSLASSFLGAGARTLLASLWRVEDTSTAQLMTRFHTAIQKGCRYADALRIAQRSLLDEGRDSKGATSIYAHPAFWAPFMLQGAL